VSLPEVPYLGVLPGTGGITRVVDKRMVRKDRADVFITLAEGIKGKKAVQWGLVDDTIPSSKFDDFITERSQTIVAQAGDRSNRRGVALPDLEVSVDEHGNRTYSHVTLTLDKELRTAYLTMRGPDELPTIPDDPATLGADWWALKAWRELDDALLHLRLNHLDIGLVIVRTEGKAETILELDKALLARADHWFINEVLHHMKRVLKRLDVSAKSIFTLIEPGSCFAGSMYELAAASDRAYMLEDDNTTITLSEMNFGPLPMGNGLTRLATRFLAEPDTEGALKDRIGTAIDGPEAAELGLILDCYDDIDWDDETRLAIEERASMSPDALTGMEANIRFAGPETLETKIFGRLSAWQNWIFQRPNAVGPEGALTLYGRPESPSFDWRRT